MASARSGVSVMKALRPRWRSMAATCAWASSAAEKARASSPSRAALRREPGEIRHSTTFGTTK